MKSFKLSVQESKSIIGWKTEKIKQYPHFVNCCSVTKWCPTLPDYMDCSMPGSYVLHYLPKFAQTDANWCYLTISSSVAPFSSCPQSFTATQSFPMNQLFVSSGQTLGASNSSYVLSMNIQGWFPLGLIGLFSL